MYGPLAIYLVMTALILIPKMPKESDTGADRFFARVYWWSVTWLVVAVFFLLQAHLPLLANTSDTEKTTFILGSSSILSAYLYRVIFR